MIQTIISNLIHGSTQMTFEVIIVLMYKIIKWMCDSK